MTYRKDKLFYEPEQPVFIKIGANLGKDTQLWGQQVKVIFEKENGPLIRAGAKPFLDYSYKDLPKGTAVGSITITIGGRILLFPLVIKDNQLFPFDTYYDQMDKSWHFMTERLMSSLINNGKMYRGLTSSEPSDEVDMTLDDEDIQPGWRDPLTSHRTKSANLNMSRMQNIAEFLKDNPDQVFLMDPKVASCIQLYGQAALHADDMIKEASAKVRYPDEVINGDVALIEKQDIDRYSIKIAARGNASIFEAVTNTDGIRTIAEGFEKVAEKILDELDVSGSTAIERGTSAPPRVISSATDIDPRQQRGHIGSAGTYTVTLDSGAKDTGLVLPIQGWQGEDTHNYLFCSPDNYIISDNIIGRRASVNNVLPRAPFNSGTRGVFVKEKEGLYFSTWPIRIEDVWSSPDAQTQIKAVDTRNMTKLNLILTDAVKVPTRIDPDIAPQLIEHGRINVYIPGDMKFSPLPEVKDQAKLAMSIGGSVIKEQAREEMLNPQTGIFEITKKAGSDRLFNVFEKKAGLRRGTDAEEEIPSFSSGDKQYVDFILKTAGTRIDMKTLDDMVSGERLTVFTPGPPSEKQMSITKMASLELERRVKRIKGEVRPLDSGTVVKLANAVCRADMGTINKVVERSQFPMLVKVAQEGQEESINKILNLNFLGEENVDYFIDRLDIMQDAEDLLTRLLIISRISNIGVNPDDVKDALRGITAAKEKFEDVKRLRLAW